MALKGNGGLLSRNHPSHPAVQAIFSIIREDAAQTPFPSHKRIGVLRSTVNFRLKKIFNTVKYWLESQGFHLESRYIVDWDSGIVLNFLSG